ncbi:MAG TPA: hypothetical protein VFG20_15910 [Planctomycetaceae bacterium]|nr:hypothetical protein [Planctomycetaceae bacterium]
MSETDSGMHEEYGHDTMTLVRPAIAVFVDRTSQQWVVRDREGQFWALPQNPNPWKHREPFEPCEESLLEPVPSHYKCFLGIS